MFPGNGTETAFLADAMLGKLAKWMRLMGCDVEYFPKISDDALVERAHRSGRTILTRDTVLIRRRKVRANHFFVFGDGYREQLRQVVAHYRIDPYARLLTRCLRCNEPLIAVEKASLAERVPPYVFTTQDRFVTCPSCDRIYWGATHKDEMVRQLTEILRTG